MRLLVADDSLLFREGLVRLLVEHGHEVIGVAADADELLRRVSLDPPTVAIVDIRMPPGGDSDGAIAAARIREEHPEVAVLLLSQHIEFRHCRDLLGEPGFGYLLKDRVLDLAEFDGALRRVADGGSALDPELVRALVRDQAAPDQLRALTGREQEVLGLVAQGRSNSAIAANLRLSERTVEAHMRAVLGKLGIEDDGGTHRRVRAVLAFLEA